VCCSLVGAADNSNGSSLSNWNAHWPLANINDDRWRWLSGITVTGTNNSDYRIQYGLGAIGYIQLSRYIGNGLIGYIHSDLSFTKISESLSNEGSTTGINSASFRFGLRKLISQQIGVLSSEIRIPSKPNYSQKSFQFKTDVVPSIYITWNNSFSISQDQFISRVLPQISLGVGYTKNFRQKPNVFIDDRLEFHLAGSINSFVKIDISPFINGSLEKLIAPLSPWEEDRQTRWLGIGKIGLDVTPTSFKWNWMKIRFSLPVYGWYSDVGFPDGTQPSPTISVAIMKSGFFNKWSNN
jgi:hypothetical protein